MSSSFFIPATATPRWWQARFATLNTRSIPPSKISATRCWLKGENGASGYFRCDWFTPDGLSTWGDGRLTLLGTEGYIEIRKYVDLTRGEQDVVYLVNKEGEFRYPVAGQVGFPFFGELILDCLHRTENAMTQAHAFKAAELCVKAQMLANATA